MVFTVKALGMFLKKKSHLLVSTRHFKSGRGFPSNFCHDKLEFHGVQLTDKYTFCGSSSSS